MNLRLSLAIITGKIFSWLSRVRGYRGSSLPGLVALKVYPGCLRHLAAQVRRGVIAVTGTNGKTTTANMSAGIFAGAGYKVIANLEGANMKAGVATSFIMKAGITGKIDCDYAVLEVDEASVPGVLAEVNPKLVVVTNFFRDQLDRYWEIDKIIKVISAALSKLNDATIVLNADDPLVAQLGKITGLPAVFYGLGEHEKTARAGNKTREARFCPFCGFALEYAFFHYGQMGTYRCPACRFARPAPLVEALEPETVNGSTRCRLVFDGREAFLAVRTHGLYNLYNALAAFSAGLISGLDERVILDSLSKYRPVAGRMEKFIYRGKQVFLSLVKNPAGFTEGLNALCAAKGTKDVFIAINDNNADGTDVSWLWDVDFERLGAEHSLFLCFFCSGKRAEEMALRLKYAGIPAEKIFVRRDLRQAVKDVLAGRGGTAYLFSTYTALWPVQKVLKQLTLREDAHDQRMPSLS
ncbi:MAG: Mur ligase family protein [Pelotomaculum sp.]|nr:Mur ligase family protein [Pelotomaculum sp.]